MWGSTAPCFCIPPRTWAKICLDVPVRGGKHSGRGPPNPWKAICGPWSKTFQHLSEECGLESCKHLGEALGRAVCPKLRASRRWGTWLKVGCICKENSITIFKSSEMRSAEKRWQGQQMSRNQNCTISADSSRLHILRRHHFGSCVFKYCFKKWALSPLL